jgi:hypothetical protein
MGMNDVKYWMKSMYEEMATLKKNHTWDLMTFPKDKNPLDVVLSENVSN